MSYQKQTFINNETVLTAEMLNHIEDGIIENENNIQSKLEESELTSAVDNALIQAKNSGDFNGPRGTGILKITTALTSYPTSSPEINGIRPLYTISLDTIISESNVSEILVGDIIEQGYYHNHIYYIDSDTAYIDKRTSIQGAKGATGSTGSSGKRGSQIFKTTKAPTSVSGSYDGVTYSFRIDRSAVTTESGTIPTVYDFDIVAYSYYHYYICAANSSYIYFSKRQSLRGAAGSDYVLTSADKQEIAEMVKELLQSS